jgi:hypothetical protein
MLLFARVPCAIASPPRAVAVVLVGGVLQATLVSLGQPASPFPRAQLQLASFVLCCCAGHASDRHHLLPDAADRDQLDGIRKPPCLQITTCLFVDRVYLLLSFALRAGRCAIPRPRVNLLVVPASPCIAAIQRGLHHRIWLLPEAHSRWRSGHPGAEFSFASFELC